VTSAPPAGLYSADRLAPLIPNLSCIGASEIALFHEQGYLAIREVFDKDSIQQAVYAVNSLIAGASPSFRGTSFEPGSGPSETIPADQRHLHVRKLMSFVEYDDKLLDMSADVGLMDLVRRLMGDETPELFQDMALLKPPGGREKPWHQDMAYFNVPIDTTVVGVWIALDEATGTNGAIHLLPGSHRRGPSEHFNRRDWQICDSELPGQTDVVVPLPPGGALLWHGLTHHGSPENESEQQRRALQFHYRPSSVQMTTTEQRMQHYGGEVRGAQC
jgi:phytanoyl-CoA hydroxylase